MAEKKTHKWGKIDYPPTAKHEDTKAGRKTESEKKTSTERQATEEHPQEKSDTQ